MAFNLQFSELQPVTFGKIEAKPIMTQERRLRVANLKIKNTNNAEACEVMSQCFGAYASEVEEFMKTNMSQMDLIKLQTYLVQGETGVADLERRMDNFMEKQMEKALAEGEVEADE